MQWGPRPDVIGSGDTVTSSKKGHIVFITFTTAVRLYHKRQSAMISIFSAQSYNSTTAVQPQYNSTPVQNNITVQQQHNNNTTAVQQQHNNTTTV